MIGHPEQAFGDYGNSIRHDETTVNLLRQMLFIDRFVLCYIAAIIYDGMLLLSVLFIATFLLLPLINSGAIESGNPIYKLFLLLITYFYFCWQWHAGGETLGMKSWRLKVKNADGINPSWPQATLRFVCALLSCALFGIGFLLILFNQQHRTLHDMLSNSTISPKQTQP